jgi:putative membrane protein
MHFFHPIIDVIGAGCMSVFFDVFIGTLVGILTGVIPGLHINMLAPFIGVSAVPIGVAISHTFFDFIPSLLLGVPDESSAIASLPGHRMVLAGRGIEAFLLSVLGGSLSVMSLVLILPIFSFVSDPNVWKILAAVSIALMLSMSNKVVYSVVIFAFTSFLSIIVNPFSQGNLIAYLTGLFGVPTLLYSLVSMGKIPKQVQPRRLRISLSAPI